ncbi:efflux RND transporter periplasmic adaptor subunit [Pelagicoccus albus]|uniref:Efflux RND transporter periplasmic adaptor subunit n=1 Tax=Pelagicoccus albus TaxID=415222 RepID=A0A7X1E9S3_9BACT|nr:efflux RND transporter periplasmic adaptor subunit [Pelagicoccus albus]MBC2608165.1 efflux RND transporter periplasmic adaptor subunit [Pelagicoccus albus]
MKKQFAYLGYILVAASAFLVGRCTFSPEKPISEHSGTHDHGAEPEEIWTCSMHPQIRQNAPGDCPICGMDLILADQSSGGEGVLVKMGEAARALAEVETTEVERNLPEISIRLVGSLSLDETKVRSISARFPARIEELFVNYTGIRVQQGDHLASIYSPELLSAQRELLLAYERESDGTFVEAARRKLRRWGLEEDQIDEIRTRGESDRFELRAPMGGVVTMKHVKEGDYLQEGSVLFEIADYSHLWLMLDAYESDLPWLRIGQKVAFSVDSYGEERFEGRVSFISPELDPATRSASVRINVENSDGRLKPGMFATGYAKAMITEEGGVFSPELAGKWISPMHPEVVKDEPGNCDVCGMALVPASELGYTDEAAVSAPILIPASAVLWTGERSVVYVETGTGPERNYEGREITIGSRVGDSFIALDGIAEGERVVARGAFKIDSSLQIQAKPSMMSMDTPHEHSSDSEMPMAESLLGSEQLEAILDTYLELQDALASDDLALAKSAVSELQEIAVDSGSLAASLGGLAAAEDLESMRRPYFDDLSALVIDSLESNSESLDRSLWRMHCPMVYSDRGADWIQGNDQLRNPFFGASMLTCGEVVRDYGND